MDCAYTPSTPNTKSKFTFDFDEKRLQTEVEMLEEKKEAAVKQVETELCHYATPEQPTLESSQSSSSDFFTPLANPSPKIYVTSPFASPLPSGPGRTKLHFSSLRQEKILKKF